MICCKDKKVRTQYSVRSFLPQKKHTKYVKVWLRRAPCSGSSGQEILQSEREMEASVRRTPYYIEGRLDSEEETPPTGRAGSGKCDAGGESLEGLTGVVWMCESGKSNGGQEGQARTGDKWERMLALGGTGHQFLSEGWVTKICFKRSVGEDVHTRRQKYFGAISQTLLILQRLISAKEGNVCHEALNM